MNKEIFERLAVIIKKYAVGDDAWLTEETKLRSDLGMSSFKMMCLIGEIEDEFSLKLQYEDAGKIVTVADAVNYISNAKQE